MPSQLQLSPLPPALLQEVDQFFLHVYDRVFRIGGERAGHAAALFLLLRKEGVLEVFAQEGRQVTHIQQVILALHEAKRSDAVNEVFYALADTLDSLGVEQLGELLHAFSGLPESFVGEYYPAVVDRLLHHLGRAEGKYAGGYDQPIELTQLMLAIAQVPEGGSVYNPFAGLASIGALLRPDALYYGQELNQRTWALGMLRLLAHRPDSVNMYYRENSLTEWNYQGKRYDLVVANPPFNMKVDDRQLEFGGRSTTAESLFLQRAIQDAKPGGKVLCVVPLSFLTSTRKDQRMLRERIVEEGHLDSVIEFPGGLLTYTSIPIVLIVVDKSRVHGAPTRMMDANRYITSMSRTEKRIEVEALLNALQGGTVAGVVEHVPPNRIRGNDYNLRPIRYLVEPAEEIEDGVPLGKLARPLQPAHFEPGAKAPFIRIRDLQEDPLEPMLQLDKAEVCEVPRHAKRLDRSALLLAMRWSSLKPTWFEYTGTPIAVTNDILVLELDQDEVDVAYLVHELLSANVQAQVEQLNRGLTVPSLRKQDILDILIELPSKLEQQAKVKGLREAHVEGLKRKAELEAERYGVELQRAGNTASLRHLLGTPLLNINSGVENIRFALDAMQPTWREHLISVREQMTLGDALDNLVHELQRVAALLETDSTELQVERFPLEDLDLLAYLKATKRRVQLDLNGGHKVDLRIAEDIKEQLRGKAIVQGNKALLDMAIDALVDNARRHAFTGEPVPHMLEFGLSLDLTQPKRFLVLSVSNNGKPFPEGFDLERYRTKNMFAGETGHTGLGGYHVNEIAQWHKGWLDLRTGKEAVGPYATTIDLYIPLSH